MLCICWGVTKAGEQKGDSETTYSLGSFSEKGNTLGKKKKKKKQRRFVFLTLLCADWSHESLDSPAVALALVKLNILPWGGIFKASPALPESSPLPYTLVHLQLTRSFLTLWFYPAKCKVKSSLQDLIYQQWIPFSK